MVLRDPYSIAYSLRTMVKKVYRCEGLTNVSFCGVEWERSGEYEKAG